MSGPQSKTCPDLDALIQQCNEDDPDPELVERIEHHLETCGVCQDAEDELTRAVVAYRSLTPTGPSAAFEEALVERLCRNPEALNHE